LLKKRKFNLANIDIPNPEDSQKDAEGLLLLRSPVVRSPTGQMISRPTSSSSQPPIKRNKTSNDAGPGGMNVGALSPFGWPIAQFPDLTRGTGTGDPRLGGLGGGQMSPMEPALAQLQQIQLQQMMNNSMPMAFNDSNNNVMSQMNAQMNQINHLAQISQLIMSNIPSQAISGLTPEMAAALVAGTSSPKQIQSLVTSNPATPLGPLPQQPVSEHTDRTFSSSSSSSSSSTQNPLNSGLDHTEVKNEKEQEGGKGIPGVVNQAIDHDNQATIIEKQEGSGATKKDVLLIPPTLKGLETMDCALDVREAASQINPEAPGT